MGKLADALPQSCGNTIVAVSRQRSSYFRPVEPVVRGWRTNEALFRDEGQFSERLLSGTKARRAPCLGARQTCEIKLKLCDIAATRPT